MLTLCTYTFDMKKARKTAMQYVTVLFQLSSGVRWGLPKGSVCLALFFWTRVDCIAAILVLPGILCFILFQCLASSWGRPPDRSLTASDRRFFLFFARGDATTMPIVAQFGFAMMPLDR